VQFECSVEAESVVGDIGAVGGGERDEPWEAQFVAFAFELVADPDELGLVLELVCGLSCGVVQGGE
jgi:hypothetical protein